MKALRNEKERNKSVACSSSSSCFFKKKHTLKIIIWFFFSPFACVWDELRAAIISFQKKNVCSIFKCIICFINWVCLEEVQDDLDKWSSETDLIGGPNRNELTIKFSTQSLSHASIQTSNGLRHKLFFTLKVYFLILFFNKLETFIRRLRPIFWSINIALSLCVFVHVGSSFSPFSFIPIFHLFPLLQTRAFSPFFCVCFANNNNKNLENQITKKLYRLPFFVCSY